MKKQVKKRTIRNGTLENSAEDGQEEDTPKINQNLLFKLAIGSANCLVLVTYLFCHYTYACFIRTPSDDDDPMVSEVTEEESSLQFKFEALLMAISMLPILALGAYQMHILFLVQK